MKSLTSAQRKLRIGKLGLAKLFAFALVCAGGLSGVSVIDAQQNWQHWRGPSRNGVAEKQKATPTEWSESENVLWKTKVPGRGHSSPVVVDGKIYLTTAENSDEKMFALAYDQKTGKQLWKTLVHEGGFLKRIHPNNSHASPTVATNGKVLFVVFCLKNETWLTKLDLSGKVLFQKRAGEYKPKYKFGFGASPIIYNDVVLVTSESQTDSFIKAYDIESGDVKWTIERNKMSSYSTPVIATIGGKDHLLMSGGMTVCSYDPKTGKKNWEAKSKWPVSCGTMVWSDKMVFASGGYPANQTLALDAKTGKVIWTNRVKMYEQSMLYHAGSIYAHSDNGRIYCWDAETGEENWSKRTEQRVSASPVVVGSHIYFTAESGNTYVIEANPEEYVLVKKNRLGTSGFASMAVIDGRIYTRVGTGRRGNYQEWLYCLGSK